MSNEEYTHQSFSKESTMDAIEKVFSNNSIFKSLPPIKKLDLSVISEDHKKILKMHEDGQKLKIYHQNLIKNSK